MSRTMMIAGGGANQIGIIRRAREMGLRAAVVDGNPEAPGFAHADVHEVVDLRDGPAIEQAARRHMADGIYPAAEWAVEAVAYAAERLELPGTRPGTARLLRNKTAMREALRAGGLPGPAFAAPESAEAAARICGEIGFPCIVKPADGNASRGVRRVDELREVDAAFSAAEIASKGAGVLVEAYMGGEEYNVDGLLYEGRYILGGITAKARSAPPNRFDLGIHMPPLERDAVSGLLEATTAEAFAAVGMRNGISHAEIMLTDEGPRVVELAGRPGGGRIPTDLIPRTYGTDFVADSLRIYLGEAPVESRRYEQGTALYWIPGDAGEIVGVEGIDEAKAIAGVREVVMHVQPGDVLETVVDCVTRDRIGYVFTHAETVEQAVDAAIQARDAVRVLTQPLAAQN